MINNTLLNLLYTYWIRLSSGDMDRCGVDISQQINLPGKYLKSISLNYIITT